METDIFEPGDTIRLFTKKLGGSKVRAMPYEGIVIAIRGKGQSKTFTVRRISAGGVVVERIFPINFPSIEKIQVIKRGKVRRAKLYYLRKK